MELVGESRNAATKKEETDAAFDRIFDETKDTTLRYIFVHADNPSNVEDIFQEVYTKLYQRISRKGSSDIAAPAAFLTKMAQREISRQHRGRKKAHIVPIEEMPVEPEAGEKRFDESVIDRMSIHCIQEIVREMPPLTYKVFVLYFFFDMSTAQIATELRLSSDAVKSRLTRARNRIRQALKED